MSPPERTRRRTPSVGSAHSVRSTRSPERRYSSVLFQEHVDLSRNEAQDEEEPRGSIRAARPGGTLLSPVHPKSPGLPSMAGNVTQYESQATDDAAKVQHKRSSINSNGALSTSGESLLSVQSASKKKYEPVRKRPRKCEGCDKVFADGGDLIRHLVTSEHGSGQRTHKCAQCDASFELLKDLRVIYLDRGKGFSRLDNLRQHVRIRHGSKQLQQMPTGGLRMPARPKDPAPLELVEDDLDFTSWLGEETGDPEAFVDSQAASPLGNQNMPPTSPNNQSQFGLSARGSCPAEFPRRVHSSPWSGLNWTPITEAEPDGLQLDPSHAARCMLNNRPDLTQAIETVERHFGRLLVDNDNESSLHELGSWFENCAQRYMDSVAIKKGHKPPDLSTSDLNTNARLSSEFSSLSPTTSLEFRPPFWAQYPTQSLLSSGAVSPNALSSTAFSPSALSPNVLSTRPSASSLDGLWGFGGLGSLSMDRADDSHVTVQLKRADSLLLSQQEVADLNMMASNEELEALMGNEGISMPSLQPSSSPPEDPTNHPQEQVKQTCFCGKSFSKTSAYNKHYKRHWKRFLCPVPGCMQRFGTKDDWRRHDSRCHYQPGFYKCLFGGHQSCRLAFTREDFETHVDTVHLDRSQLSSSTSLEEMSRQESILRDPERRKTLMIRCHVGQGNDEDNFWCGFCRKLIPIKDEDRGLKARSNRVDHIADHFKTEDTGGGLIDGTAGLPEWKCEWVPYDDYDMQKTGVYMEEDKTPASAGQPTDERAPANKAPTGVRKASMWEF